MDIDLQSGQIHCNGNTTGVIYYARSPWVTCLCHHGGAVGQVARGEEWSWVVVGMVLLVEQTTEVGWGPDVGEAEVERL